MVQIRSLSLNGAAFIAFNRESYDLSVRLQTGMPAGTYCDVISGNPDDAPCPYSITVDGSGYADIYIRGGSEDPIVAIHI